MCQTPDLARQRLCWRALLVYASWQYSSRTNFCFRCANVSDAGPYAPALTLARLACPCFVAILFKNKTAVRMCRTPDLTRQRLRWRALLV